MCRSNREDVLRNIQNAPYLHVIIRPVTFEEERLSLNELWHLAETCRVSLRGWDYPHFDFKNQTQGKDWISSWCELFRGHQEHWKFFQSGQFDHYFSFWEDGDPEEVARKAKSRVPFIPEKFKPSGYLSVFSALYNITEIFEFAARLASKQVFDESIIILVEMKGIKDRVLFFWDFEHSLNSFYAATCDLDRQWELSINELIGNSAQISFDATIWFLERFQWREPNRSVLSSQQQAFLRRQT